MEDDKKGLRSEIRAQSFGYILTALGLVAGLAWNEAITALIKTIFPLGGGLFPKFIYAIIVTIVVIVVSKSLLTLSKTDQH